MAFRTAHVEAALEHLAEGDQVMRRIIAEVGPFRLRAQRDYYQVLVRSIVGQQISTAAARTITQRLLDHLHPAVIAPEPMAKLDLQTLRSLGLSQQKATYVIDLTQRVAKDEVNLRTINRKPDEAVVAELTQVKGIGVWTAHMFMIFALARLDVLPVGDFGIRTAIQRRYGLAELPRPAEIEAIARPWRPYASIASWYLWRSLELKTEWVGQRVALALPVFLSSKC
jgi:DNA-3-methyladenine glycosylase II